VWCKQEFNDLLSNDVTFRPSNLASVLSILNSDISNILFLGIFNLYFTNNLFGIWFQIEEIGFNVFPSTIKFDLIFLGFHLTSEAEIIVPYLGIKSTML
jgi:hypothetical protein